jgi:hypothetical protein
MCALLVAAANSSGVFDTLKHYVNLSTKPAPFITISIVVFALMFVLY